MILTGHSIASAESWYAYCTQNSKEYDIIDVVGLDTSNSQAMLDDLLLFQKKDAQAHAFAKKMEAEKQRLKKSIGEFVYFTTSDTRFVFSLSGRFVFASSLDLMIPVEHINQGPQQSG
mgnify:CR=1 FL=1